jgi:hypothetical protein
MSSTMRRTSRSEASEARRSPSVMPAQTARSNIHAGITTLASSASMHTKTSSPRRFSR